MCAWALLTASACLYGPIEPAPPDTSFSPQVEPIRPSEIDIGMPYSRDEVSEIEFRARVRDPDTDETLLECDWILNQGRFPEEETLYSGALLKEITLQLAPLEAGENTMTVRVTDSENEASVTWRFDVQ